MPFAGCYDGGYRTTRVSVAGSQVAVELVTSWLDAAEYGQFDVTRGRMFLSDAGFGALRKGVVDLACTDRRITPREVEAFGDDKPVEHAVAFYGYGLYVNVGNPVDSVLAAHLSLIYRGQVGNWSMLGWPAQNGEPTSDPSSVNNKDQSETGPPDIALYGPPKGSRGGELLARQAGIWFDEPRWTVIETPEGIIEAVAADPGALGFAPIGYDSDRVRYLGLRMDPASESAWPSREEIEAERYGFAKVIYVYARAPIGPNAQAVIDYLRSPLGVAAIRGTGLHPMSEEPRGPQASGTRGEAASTTQRSGRGYPSCLRAFVPSCLPS